MTAVYKFACDEAVIRSTASPPRVARHAGTWVLAATILGSSMSSIDGTVVNVALPVLQRELHATSGDLQWVIEAYSLLLSSLILVGGSLGDRLGRRRIFGIGVAIFTLASVFCGLAPNIGVLVAARGLQGIGGALLVPGSLAIISAAFDEQSRGKAIGTWAGFTTVTTAFGPVLGGWLVQSASWRWVFFINVPVAAITLLLLFRFVPESHDPDTAGRLDWLGATLITLSLAALVFGLIQADTRGLGDPTVLAILAAGIVMLGCFLLVEARIAHPMMPLYVFRSPTFAGANVLTLLLYGALGGGLYFFPFNLQQVQGYTALQAGAALLPFTVIVFALSRWTGGLLARYGARIPLVIGASVTAVGFMLFARPGVGGSYWTTFFPAVVMMSLGMALVIAPLTTAVMNAVPADHAGVASGVNNAISRAAGLLAIAVLGLVIASTFSAALDSNLRAAAVPASLRQQISSQRAKLAGVQLPAGTSPAVRAALQRVVDDAFVSGFRTVMLVCAALALASALAGALLLRGKTPEPALSAAPVVGRGEATSPQPAA